MAKTAPIPWLKSEPFERLATTRIPAVRVAQCGVVLVHVEVDADTGAVQSVERIGIIPEQRFYDLTGIHSITCPFSGARTLAVDRAHWDATATAWQREDMRQRWDNWVKEKITNLTGYLVS